VGDQDYDFLQSNLGVKIERPWWTDRDGRWVPEVHFKWLYDFIGDDAATTSTFTGGGASFSTRGAEPAQHSFNVGAGLTFYSNGNFSVSGTYDLELKEDYIGHTGQGVFRVKF
jgi:outer membrane autotransporter protein